MLKPSNQAQIVACVQQNVCEHREQLLFRGSERNSLSDVLPAHCDFRHGGGAQFLEQPAILTSRSHTSFTCRLGFPRRSLRITERFIRLAQKIMRAVQPVACGTSFGRKLERPFKRVCRVARAAQFEINGPQVKPWVRLRKRKLRRLLKLAGSVVPAALVLNEQSQKIVRGKLFGEKFHLVRQLLLGRRDAAFFEFAHVGKCKQIACEPRLRVLLEAFGELLLSFLLESGVEVRAANQHVES